MNNEPFPRKVLVAAAAAVALSLMTAAVGRMTGTADSSPTAQAVASRELLFRDQPNGGVTVYDARDASMPIETVAPATNGFLRATMRGLARQRIRQDSDREIPFRLTSWADGRLTLEDPATGRRVEMEAFGMTNEVVFARLLTAHAGSQGAASKGAGS